MEEAMNTILRIFSRSSLIKSIPAFIAVLFLSVTATAQAGSGISVSVSASGISASATVGGVDAMLLRVGGPGDFFAEARSEGSSVNWSLPGNAPDGAYRYEVSATASGTAYRETGRFSVSGGQIFERKLRKSQSSPSLWRTAARALDHVGQGVLDILVPAAQAQGDALVSSAFPTVEFDDTNDVGINWDIFAPAFGFAIFDEFSNTLPLEIDSTALSDFAFFSDTNGDVSFADDAVFVDRDAIRLGVGTITPTSPIHVMKADGTAQVLVEETNAAVAARSLFNLNNNGPVGFNMLNTDTNEQWRFAAQTDGFRVSLAGSGGPELTVFETGAVTMGPGGVVNFDLDPTGNLTVVGTATATAHLTASDRNLKENFVALEGGQVLAKLTALPVTEWSFKGDPVRHIGPTAQDFKAAFDLGADDTHIASLDVASVAVVGVKALHKMIEAREATITQQQAEIAALKQRLAALEAREARLQALEAAVQQLLAGSPPPHVTAAALY
jgi:hypothetical protein